MKRTIQIAAAFLLLGILIYISLHNGIVTTSCCMHSLSEPEKSALWARGIAGDREAHWKLVEHAYDSNDLDLALKNLEELSLKYSDKRAMYELFVTTTANTNMPDKYKSLAMLELEKSANGNYGAAQIMIAQNYEFGRYGYNKDICLAKKWYKLANINGVPAAKFYLDRIQSNDLSKSCQDGQ